MSSNLWSAVASLTFSLSPCPSRRCPGYFAAIYGVLLQVSSFGWLRLATVPHCTATWRELGLHIALFSPINRFSCSSIFWIALENKKDGYRLQNVCQFLQSSISLRHNWVIQTSNGLWDSKFTRVHAVAWMQKLKLYTVNIAVLQILLTWSRCCRYDHSEVVDELHCGITAFELWHIKFNAELSVVLVQPYSLYYRMHSATFHTASMLCLNVTRYWCDTFLMHVLVLCQFCSDILTLLADSVHSLWNFEALISRVTPVCHCLHPLL